MRHTHTQTSSRTKGILSAWTVACFVLALARGPLTLVQPVEAASSFRPNVFVNTEAFLAIDDDDTTADVTVRFGDTLAKTITFNRANDRFEVNDDVSVTGTLRATGTVSGSLATFTGGGNNSFMGNIGIGTTTPDTLLYAKGANPHFTFENTTDHTGKSYFGTFNDATRTLIQLSANRKTSDGSVPDAGRAPAYMDIVSTAGNGYIDFSTTTVNGGSPLSAMRVNGNGNVGIGTATTVPDAKLEVAGTISGTFLFASNSLSGAGLVDCDTAGTSKLLWDASTGRFSCGTDADTNTTYTAGQGLSLNGTTFRLNATVTGSTVRATTTLASSGALVWEGAASGSSLTVSGNAGIGTTSPDKKLEINSANGNNLRLTYGDSNGSADYYTDFLVSSDGSLTIDSSGNSVSVTDTLFAPALLINESSPYDNSVTFETYGKGGFTDGTRGAYFADSATPYAGYFFDGANSVRIGDGTYAINAAGNSMFDGAALFNNNGADADFRVESIGNENMFFVDASTDRVGIGTAAPKTTLDVIGTVSGASLFASDSLSGAGLVDCDNSTTSKLLWDASTGRFSCGTDQSGGGTGGGLSLADADARYVQKQGGTMTGKLTLSNTTLAVTGSGQFTAYDPNDVVLRVKGDMAQSGNLQEWVDGNDTMYANITAYGDLNLLYNVNANYSYFSGNVNASGVTVRGVTDCGGLGTYGDGTIYCAGGGNNSGYFGITNGNVSDYIYDYENISITNDSYVGVYLDGNNGLYFYSNNAYANAMNQNVGMYDNVNFYALNVNTTTSTYDASASNNLTVGNVAYFNGSIGTDMAPVSDNTYGIGNSGNRWSTGWFTNLNVSDSGYVGNNLSVGGVLSLGSSDGNVYGNVIAYGDNMFNVGSQSNKWLTGYFNEVRATSSLSGATLYTNSFYQGAGLADCDNSTTSKLLWDSSTGRFSCGTDQSGGGSGGNYVLKTGDTMTGKLTLSNSMLAVTGSGQFTGNDASDVVLRVKGNAGQSANLQEWVDANNGMYANVTGNGAFNALGNVQIGQNNSQYLNVGSNTTFSGNAAFNGSLSATNNTFIGNDNGDYIYFGGDVNSSFNPDSNNTYSLGNSTNRWIAWLSGLNVSGNTTLGGSSSDTISFTGAANSNLFVNSNNAYNVGNSANRWSGGWFVNVNASSDIAALNNLSVGNVAYFNGSVGSNVSPLTNNSYNVGSSTNRWAGGWFVNANVATDLSVGGNTTLSANVGVGGAGTSKAKLAVLGSISGTTLYTDSYFQGAGLSDCDNGTTSKLLWDASTGRFSCGTDQSGGGSGGNYVLKTGDTMTGKLTLSNTMLAVTGSGQFTAYDPNDVVLRVKGDMTQSGNLQEWVDGNDTMYVNIAGNGDLNALGNVQIGQNTGQNLNVYANATFQYNLTGNYGYFSNLGAYYGNFDYVNGNSTNMAYDVYAGGNVSGSNVVVRGVTSCSGLGTYGDGTIYCSGGGNNSGYFGITDGFTTSYIYDYNNITFNHDSYINVTVDGSNNVNISSNNSYANAMNQNVGIYDNVSFYSLNVSTDTYTGNANVAGNLTVGNVAYFNGSIGTNVSPLINNSYNLGDSSNRWAGGWFVNANVSGDLSATGNTTIDNLNASKSATSGSILVSRTGSAPEWKAPTGSMVWYLDGVQTVGASKGAAVTMAFGLTATSVNLRATGAPTGAAYIVDIKENGTTIFSTKPQINAASLSGGGSAVFSDTDIAADSVVTVDVTQIGSTFAGSGITVQLNGIRKY